MLFDEETFNKMKAAVPTYKMITPSILADRLRVNGSLARAAIKVLADEVRPLPLSQNAGKHCRLPCPTKGLGCLQLGWHC